ncbi:MAG: hypothetical protein WCW16_04835 [Candidatus Magasanikbacteria bacterium]
MGPQEFPRPSFVKEGVKVSPLLENKRFGEGSFAVVARLENLPEEVREHVPDGYVVKYYKNTEFDRNWGQSIFSYDREIGYGSNVLLDTDLQTFCTDALMLARIKGSVPTVDQLREYAMDRGFKLQEYQIRQAWKVVRSYSLSGIAKRLQDRHECVKEFFSDVSPELVVPTKFLVGETSGNQKRLFEIQPNIPGRCKFSMPDKLNFIILCVGKHYDRQRLADTEGLDEKHFSEENLSRILEESSVSVANEIRRSFPHESHVIKEELERVMNKAPDFVLAHGQIPYDIFFLSNMLITRKGPRIIDTNLAVPNFPEDEGVHLSPSPKLAEYTYNQSILFWKKVAEKLPG